MPNNHKQGQRIRRLTEALSRTDAVQDVVIDVVADHSQRLNDIDRRLAEVERSSKQQA